MTYQYSFRHRNASGFTMVELSIVMVIIGLLIGGVFVGKDLIRSAEIRSQITDLESYQTALGTFAMRFEGLPGDIKNARDVLSITDSPTIANGDGDGLLEDGAGGTALFTGEIAQFWMQLSTTKMVKGAYAIDASPGKGYPMTAFGRGGIVTKYDPSVTAAITSHGANVFFIGMTGVVSAGTDETIVNSAVLYPEDAWKIDEKIDDGKPFFGSVRARAATYADPNYLDVFYAPSNPAATMLAWAMQLLVPQARAANGTSVDEEAACVYLDDADPAGENAATYAMRTSGITCMLSVELKR